MEYHIVPIRELFLHECTDELRLRSVRDHIATHKTVHPIIVDKLTFQVLDGHHRVHVLEEMGYRTVPAYTFPYYRMERPGERESEDCVRAGGPVSPDDIDPATGRIKPDKVPGHILCGGVRLNNNTDYRHLLDLEEEAPLSGLSLA